MSSPSPLDEGFRLEVLRGFRILDTSPEPAFDDIVRLATLICDTPLGKIGFVDQQRVWLKARVGIGLDEIPRGRSFSAHAILRSDLLLVADPFSDTTFANSFLVNEIGVRFFAGVPLVTSSHQAIGVLAVMDRVPHLLTDEQIDSLQILARRIMHELELRCKQEHQSTHPGLHLATSLGPPVTILLVEDNDNLRNLLQRTLEGAGFSVFAAADGTEALRVCQEREFTLDLVVSDIVMPRINGIELLHRVHEARPETQFLFITGFGDQFPELAELGNGANVLEKPFLPSELLRRVKKTLDQGNAATGTEG